MLFFTGGSNKSNLTDAFRQLKPALDTNRDGQVTRDELFNAKRAADAGQVSPLYSQAINELFLNFGNYYDPNSGFDGLREEDLERKRAEEEAAEAKAEEERLEQQRLEQERQEKMRADAERARERYLDKEAINREAKALNLFKVAYRQITGEEASALDVRKWQIDMPSPTTSLAKAREDVLAIRPELREQVALGKDLDVLQERRDAIAEVAARVGLGSSAVAIAQDYYANKGGSIESITADFLNAYA